jgi:uncharacterized protein with NRDE domain
MCLIFFAWRRHAAFPLVVAANRDEFYERPTAPAAFWNEAPGLLAGRDLTGGGTWLGVTRGGRFLLSDVAPGDYMESLAPGAGVYNGFNLLVGDRGALYWYSNRGGEPRPLGPGAYGISNALLDTPWPKLVQGKKRFEALLEPRKPDPDEMFDLLSDRRIAFEESLPDTGVGFERERTLSPIFISAGDYGTRSSTVVLMGADGNVEFHERTHEPTRERGTYETKTLTYAYPVEPDREAV